MKIRDMRKNPKGGDTWIERGRVWHIGSFTARTPIAIKSIVANGGEPAVVIPIELAVRLHAVLTNPTQLTKCQDLHAELEKYLPVEE